jgi:hypothetical protein
MYLIVQNFVFKGSGDGGQTGVSHRKVSWPLNILAHVSILPSVTVFQSLT